MLKHYLTQTGFTEISTLNNPLEVHSFVLEHRPDLLLLDISMPQINGLKVLEQLGDLVVDDSLTVIMVTSSEEDYVKRKALILGACDFISKPVDSSELARRVENAILGKPNSDFILNSLPPRLDGTSSEGTQEPVDS